LYIALAAVFGLFTGSFLNVCIDRLPGGKSIAFPPSHCESDSQLRSQCVSLSIRGLLSSSQPDNQAIASRNSVSDPPMNRTYMTSPPELDLLGTGRLETQRLQVLEEPRQLFPPCRNLPGCHQTSEPWRPNEFRFAATEFERKWQP